MAIGIVKALVGTTTATDSRGITRVLRVGDTVELNETVQASNGSTILIQFDNGGFATLGSNDKLVLDQSVLDPAPAETQMAQGEEQNVADIQAMIEAGMDPTQIAEATAAGADAGNMAGDPGHSGSHSFVVVDQEGARADVTPGFGTDTSASPLNTETTQTAEPRFFINPAATVEEAVNTAPVITERSGDALNLKEAGVGTIEQGGKGWAIGDHNHAIAGISRADGSFTVSDADGDSLSARLVDGNGNPVEGVVTDPDTGVMTLETGYGTLTVTPTVNSDGSVTYGYSFELNDHANSLNEGQSVNYDYNIEVSDGRGGSVSENVNVNIDGTNDAPTMKFDSVHVKEEGAGTSGIGGNNGFVGDNHHRFVVHGDLSAKAGDPDAGAELSYSVSIQGGEKNLETASTGGNAVTDADGNNVSVPVDVLPNTTVDGIQTIVTNYGTFTLDTATGEYTFELNTADGSPANNLAMGEFLNLGFTSTVTDQSGAIGQHMVRVTIEGSNDAPTLSVPGEPLDAYQGSNGQEYIGQVEGSDIDHGAKLAYSFGNDENGNPVTTIETPYGTVTIDPATGEYNYAVKSDAPEVSGNDPATDTFTVRVTDEHGAFSEAQVSVNVHGNRPPEIVDHDEGNLNVKESGVIERGENVPDGGYAEGINQTRAPGVMSDGGSFTVKDADTGDALKATIVDRDGNPLDNVQVGENGVMTVVTEYGTLTVTPMTNEDGSVTYDYQFDLDNSAANSLAQGEHNDVGFQIQISDSHGASVTQDVNVRIEGTNDAPKIVYESIHMKDDGVYNGNESTSADDRKNSDYVFEQNHRTEVSGQLHATDPDSDGKVTFGINVNTTDKGGINQSGITVNLYTGEGKNAQPVLDDKGQPVSETLKVLSSEIADGIQTVETNYGTLTLNTVTGEYTFTLNGAAADYLAAGEKFDFHFTTTATDQYGAQDHHNLNVIIEGSNDIPTLTIPDKPVDIYQGGSTGEEGINSVSGTVTGSDADHGAKLTYSFGNDGNGNPVTTIETPYGIVTIDPATGEYTYKVNGDAQGFDELDGKDTTDNFTVRVTDEHGAFSEAQVSVNVHGNRPPEIVDRDDGNLTVRESGVTERGEGVPNAGWSEGINQTKVPGVATDGGSFTVRDPDARDVLKATIVDKDGQPLNNVQVSGDGTMTVVTEYGVLTVTPTVNIDGSVKYDYKFDLDDKSVNNLAQGEKVPLDWQINVSDSGGETVSQPVHVTIEGTNDKPDVKGTQVHVKEEGIFQGEVTTDDGKNNGNMQGQYHRETVEGKVNFSDPDSDAALTFEAGLSSDRKVVTEATTPVFTGATPSSGQLTGATEKVVVEKTDVHVDENGHRIQVIETNYGTLELNTVTGDYSFTLNGAAADHLAAGEKFVIDFRVTATDEHNAQGHHDNAIHITVEGANDAPAFVQLEHNDYLGAGQPSIGLDGKWEVEAAEQGRWRGTDGNSNRVSDHSDILTGSFVASDRDRGETDTLTFSADFLGGSTSGVHKTGLEQEPAYSLQPKSVEEKVLAAGEIHAEHADKGTGHYTEVPAGTYKVFSFEVGDFYLDVQSGDYYFKVNDNSNIVKGMNLGDTHSLNFSVSVTDAHGASSSHDFTINITGRNDRPVLEVVKDENGNEHDHIQVFAGQDSQETHGNLGDNFKVNDDDIGDTHTFHIVTNPTMNGNNPGDYNGRQEDFDSNRFDNYNPVSQLEGEYGVLTIDQNTGDYTYRLYEKGEGHDEAWQKVQELGKDGSLDEVFHIGVKDFYNAFDIREVHIAVKGNGSDVLPTSDIQPENQSQSAESANVLATITDSPIDHAAAPSYDTTVPPAIGTGVEQVTDMAGHHPQDQTVHTDGLEGMIAAADTIEHGTAGNDMLTGSHGHDVLYGEGGHDLMVGDGSDSSLDALAGLVHTDAHADSALNAIHSMSADELHNLSSGLESLEHHNDGNDLLIGGDGHDVLIGMGGNDVLHGGDGHDVLFGGSGNDVLAGGKGDDVLAGGSGHDIFQYHQGDLDGVVHGDHITDFHLGNQAIDANADVLDIGDLLHGSGAKADGSDLFSGGFLQLEVISHDEDKGTATVKLSVDQDGSAGSEHGSVDLATINMTGVHGLGGMNSQNQADHLMQQLMDNHAIKL